MNRAWLVFKHEMHTIVSRFSFLFTLVILPLTSFGVFFGVELLQRDQPDFKIDEIFVPAEESLPDGYVDLSGVVQRMPPELTNELLRFESEEQAENAMLAGEIGHFYIVSADYLSTGRVTIVQSEFNPIGGIGSAEMMNVVLRYNLLDGDAQMAARFSNPLILKETVLTKETARDMDSPLTFFIPYAVAMLLYIVILTSASLMLSSVTKEKENRVLEILLSSIRPIDLLSGKMIALGLSGLLQTVTWAAVGWGLLQLSGRSFNLQIPVELSPMIILWIVLFFLLGYFLYASLMAGIGALVPNIKEASQLTMLVVMPMIVPLVFIGSLMTQPNGTLSMILSLFPLTSPVSMTARLSASASVPAWQIVIALALLVLACGWVIRSVSRLFHAQVMLTGQKITIKTFIRALLAPQS